MFDAEDDGKQSRRGHKETHLHVGEVPWAIHGVTSQELGPCYGIVGRDSNED